MSEMVEIGITCDVCGDDFDIVIERSILESRAWHLLEDDDIRNILECGTCTTCEAIQFDEMTEELM